MVKLETDVEVRRDSVDVNQVLQRVIGNLSEMIDARKQSISFEGGDNLPKVVADIELLSHAFAAILRNAVRYSQESETIGIYTEATETDVVVKFIDNGVGISEEAIPRIFERFYRVDEAHSSAGFGIGLSIAKASVALHGGTLAVDSTVGEGTTVTITLPHE